MNKQKLLDLIGPAFLCHEINCKPVEQIASDLAEDIIKAYEAKNKTDVKVLQREVSDMANKILKVVANNTPDNIKESVINGINYVLSKANSQPNEVEPIPTVDEDELWNDAALVLFNKHNSKVPLNSEIGGRLFNGFKMDMDALKKQFSIMLHKVY